ncbi:MAG: hypothetical protein SGI89_02185 [bacterium]|nr:hypothetical protein [bacterium]
MSIETDYIPLNPTTIQSGQYFGTHSYSIPTSSHKHHLEYLAKGNPNSLFQFKSDFLFSFEMFPLPRVLASLGGFKRVNEIISIHGERIISRLPKIDEELFTDVKVDKVFSKNGIVFGYFTSTTKTESGVLLMTSNDKAILLNQTDKSVFRKVIKEMEKTIPFLKITDSIKHINTIQLFFRHKWDDKIWLNNIHTDSYASYLGYEKGLIEAPCFVDILLSNSKTGMLLKNGVSLTWKYYAPLCHGILTNIFLERKNDINSIYVCNAKDNTILMTLKISTNE